MHLHNGLSKAFGFILRAYRLDQTRKTRHWQIILIDSDHQPMPDSYEGEVSEAELHRLGQLLARRSDKWTMIGMHHNLPAHDEHGVFFEIRNYQQVMECFEQQSKLKLVLSGHVHQEFVIVQSGISYLSTPSTGYQSLSKSGNVTNESPGYRRLKHYPNGRFETDVRRVTVCVS